MKGVKPREKFVYILQIPLQFDEFLTNKFKILILRIFDIFTKTSHPKLVGTPCIKRNVWNSVWNLWNSDLMRISKQIRKSSPLCITKTSLTNQFVFSDSQFLSAQKNRDRYRSIHHFSLGDAERKAQSLDISVLYRSFLTIIFHLLWIWGPYASCFIFRGSRIVHMH